jgi:hypothetical protein
VLEQSSDRAFAAADRAVKQEDSLFDAVALRRALEGVDQVLQRFVEAEDKTASRPSLSGSSKNL